jgi:hypothetical protein
MIRTVCFLAGSISFLDDVEAEVRSAGLSKAVAAHDTARIYDWLVKTFSYQGISDQVARGYMAKHGAATWSDLQQALTGSCSCPKLGNYWRYEGCRFDKGSRTCAEPDHIDACPVPRPRLRNGRLNQTAFSLFLFIRDIADGDVVRWIDDQLNTASAEPGQNVLAARQEALIGPLRNVYGVADKVLTMTLSTLLMGMPIARPIWFETGAAMMAIDTLVHNFLHRTGILQDCGKTHQYGAACYQTGGCANVIRLLSSRINAKDFNPAFPTVFPRFIQHGIWRYCAADGLNVCNGNRIDDRDACRDTYCRLGSKCGRKPLK